MIFRQSRAHTPWTQFDSVHIANAILKHCFAQKNVFRRATPITFGQLERATLRVESIMMCSTGRHAIADFDYPSIVSKNSTVDRAELVRKYIPWAIGPKTAAKPTRSSALHQALTSSQPSRTGIPRDRSLGLSDSSIDAPYWW